MRNYCSTLAELKMEIEGNCEPYKVIPQLRVNADYITEGTISIGVEARQLILSLDLTGYEIKAGSRYGEPNVTNETILSEKVNTTEKKTTSIAAGAEGKFSPKNFGLFGRLGGAYNKTRQLSTDISGTFESTHYRVRASTDDRWIISNPDLQRLDGTYMDGTITLCELKQTRGANRLSLSAKLLTRQRDLILTILDNKTRRPPPHDALLKIFIAKLLHEQASTSDYQGYLVLSEGTLADEG